MRTRTPFGNRDCCVGDGIAVETDVLQRKAGSRVRSPPPLVIGREITIDAVLDLRPQYLECDRLGDVEAAVGLYRYIADEVCDALGLSMSGRCAEEQQRQRERDPGGRHRSAESNLWRGARGLIAELEIACSSEIERRGGQIARKGLDARIHLARDPVVVASRQLNLVATAPSNSLAARSLALQKT